MKPKHYLLLAVAFLYANFTNAQNTLDNIGLTSSTPASVAYSLRQLSSSYTGPLVRIKVGSSFYDVYPDASTKNFSLSSKISAAISTYNAAVSVAGANALSTIITSGSTNATAAIWYDQSGYAVHVFSAVNPASPTQKIISLGNIKTINGIPTIYFDRNDWFMSANTVDYSAQTGATVNAIAQNVATTTGLGGIIGTAYVAAQPGYGISFDGTNSIGYFSDGAGCEGQSSGVNSTDPKILTDIFLNNSTSLSNFYVNGVLKTPSSGACTIYPTSGSKVFIGCARGFGSFAFNGNISEAIIFPKKLTAGEQSPLESNQTLTYFSPSVSISSNATNNTICAGTSVIFTATPYNVTSPTYQWKKNGLDISGETGTTYTTSTLVTNDVISLSSTSSISSNTITTTVNASPTINVTVNGDGCVNKTTFTATTGLTSYAWYKDNVAISGETTNTYTPTAAGSYQVQVSNGTCTNTSTATTIYTCGVTADGKMTPIANANAIVSNEGGVNFGTGEDFTGKILNTTGLTTTKGTIGSSTAVLGGVISATNAITSSIGVIYSTDSNFGTYSTTTIQSNVAAGTYTSTISGLTSLTTYYAKSFIVNKAGTSYGAVVNFTTSPPPVLVGDVYGGGIVYYILKSGDNGYDANVQHGLIAAETNQTVNASTWIKLALNGNAITGAQNTGTLVGKTNTAAIIANQGTASSYLFKYVNETPIGTYSDWYVPSKKELELFQTYIFTNTTLIGGVSTNRYTNDASTGDTYYWRNKINSTNKYAWGHYFSSTQNSDNTYVGLYMEIVGSFNNWPYSRVQDGNFTYVAIRSF